MGGEVMIRPAFNWLAVPGVTPPLVDFQRNGAATFVSELGYVREAPAGALRDDHHPLSGRYLGKLIEEGRENLCRRSSEFNDSAWVKSRSSVIGSTIGPDGVAGSGLKLVEDSTAGNTHYIYQNVTITADTEHVFSVFLKKGERDSAYVQMSRDADKFHVRADLDAGTVEEPGTSGAATVGSASLEDFGRGWYRLVLTGKINSSSTNMDCRVMLDNGTTSAYDGDGSSGFYVWGAQLEAGAYATSHIPTADSSVSRPDDEVSIDLGHFRFNPEQGTMYLHSHLPAGLAGYPNLLYVNDGGSAEQHKIFLNPEASKLYAQTKTGGISQNTLGSAELAFPAEVKACYAYAQDDFAASFCGADPVLDSSGGLPSGLTFMALGYNLVQRVRQVAFFPRRLGNGTIKSLTA